MKITKKQLKQIIESELKSAMKEGYLSDRFDGDEEEEEKEDKEDKEKDNLEEAFGTNWEKKAEELEKAEKRELKDKFFKDFGPRGEKRKELNQIAQEPHRKHPDYPRNPISPGVRDEMPSEWEEYLNQVEKDPSLTQEMTAEELLKDFKNVDPGTAHDIINRLLLTIEALREMNRNTRYKD